MSSCNFGTKAFSIQQAQSTCNFGTKTVPITTALIDLLPYFISSVANGNKALNNTNDLPVWGKPKARTVTLEYPNGDITMFETLDNEPIRWAYMKYIDADKMFYGMGCTSTGDTINGVQNFDTAVHVNEGRTQAQGAKWCPRYMTVGQTVTYQNWNMYYYDTYTHAFIRDNGFWPMTTKLDFAGMMNVGGDLGSVPVIRVIWTPNSSGGGYPEHNYYALGWGRIGWAQYNLQGQIVQPTNGQIAFWTKINQNGVILPNLSPWPTKICGLPITVVGGQTMSIDSRCP